MILQLTSLLGKSLLLLLLGELTATQVVQAQVTCRPGVGRIVTVAGTTQLQAVAQAWANGFRTFCNETSNRYFITPSGNGGTTAFGVNRLCGVGSGSVDIALVEDELLPATGVIEIGSIGPVDLFQSRCIKGVLSRTLIKLQVASNRVVIALRANTPVAQCIQKLGGLTRGQLRWMFSNYTLTQLLNSGLSPKEVPNSDLNDSTRRWHELSADCPNVEINQTKSIDSDVNDFFFSRILSNQSNGEVNRPTPTLDINSLPSIRSDAISIVDFATYSTRLSPSQRANLYVVPLKESAAGLDPLTFHLSLLVRSDDVSLLVDGSLPIATFAYSNLGTQQVVANSLVAGDAAANAKRIGASYGMHPSSATATCEGPVTSTNVLIAGDVATFAVADAWSDMYNNLFSAANIVASKTDSTDGARKVCLGQADIADMDRNFLRSEITPPPPYSPTFVCQTTGAYLHQVTVAKTTGGQSLFMNLLWSTRGNTIPFVCCGFSPAGRDVVHGARLTQVTTPSLCTVPSS